jgi:hypothetical protein
MGRGFIEYHLPDSGRDEAVLFSAFINYCLPDGTKLPILQNPAWCPDCRAFIVAEDVPPVESLTEEIRKLEAGDPESLQIWAFVSNGEPIEARVTELHRRIQWRQGRKSPPRCLYCGSTAVVPIPWNGEFAHPQTGDRVVVDQSGFADTAPWFADFSPEGEQIAGENEGKPKT